MIAKYIQNNVLSHKPFLYAPNVTDDDAIKKRRGDYSLSNTDTLKGQGSNVVIDEFMLAFQVNQRNITLSLTKYINVQFLMYFLSHWCNL
jgi:hypothetical protein